MPNGDDSLDAWFPRDSWNHPGARAVHVPAPPASACFFCSGSEDKAAGNLVLPEPLKQTGDENVAGEIDVGSPAGAWGPDDEEKDDWVNLFGMDGGRARVGDSPPSANLPVRLPTVPQEDYEYRSRVFFLVRWSTRPSNTKIC